MHLKLYLFLIIFILCKNSTCFPKLSKNSNSESLLSIKNVNNIMDTVLPLFLNGPKDVVGRAKGSPMFKTLKDLKETMTKSVKSKEGWTSFGKRALSYFLTGKKALENEKEVDVKLAHKLYEKSPEFVKDTVKAQLDGSVMPVLEKKIHDLIKTIKEKKATSSDNNLKVEGKQGTPFDPLVFGVNALINMFWFTTMNGYFLQNMGLENLFNPDFDYDYDSLCESGEIYENGECEEGTREEEEEGAEGEGEEGEGEGEGGGAAGGQHDDASQNAIPHDTYSHYPGQKMKLQYDTHPKIQHPSPNYNYFKLYNPNKRTKKGRRFFRGRG